MPLTLRFNRHDGVYTLLIRRGMKDVELTSFVKIAPKRYQVGSKTYTSPVAAAAGAMDRYLRKQARTIQRQLDDYTQITVAWADSNLNVS